MRTLLVSTGLAALTLAAAPAAAQSFAPAEGGAEPDQLPPVSVLATRTAIRPDEAPATVSVITAREIEAMLATDIKDLVRFEPGVSVVSQPARFGAALGTTGRGGNEGFTIRGLGGDRVLMVVDGVRVPDGFVFGAQSVGRGGYADLDLMKSVEILRGAASALYGSDGVAGAVSFVTRDPEDLLRADQSLGVRARVAYNSADENVSTSLMLAGGHGPLSGLLAWTGREGHETGTQGTVGGVGAARTEANPQDTTSDALLAKLVWQIAPGRRLRAGYDRYDSRVTADVLSGRSASVLQLLADDTTRREGWSLGWEGDETLGLERSRLTVYGQSAQSRQFTSEDRQPAADRTRDNTFDNEVFGLSADATLQASAHRLTFGGDWSETTQQGVRDGTAPPFGETFPTSAFPKTDYTLAGVFVQDEISLLGGDLRVIPALRRDSYELTTAADPLYPGARADQSGDHVSPRLGVVWQATDWLGLFGNWGEGFKAPTPSQVNNFFGNLAFGYISAPNPDLKPETSRSLEVGARVRDLALPGGGLLSGQAVVFRSEYEDFISQQVVSGSFTPADPAVFQWINFTDVEVSGFEARADAWWDNGVSARFAFAYADGETTSRGVTTALPTIDPVKVVFGLGYDEPAGRFGAQAILTWSQAKDAADTDGLACFDPDPALGCAVGDDFVLLDLTAHWNVSDRVTARIGVFNVLDETYSWWSDVRGVAASSPSIDAYTQPGRNVGLSLALRY